MLGSTLSLLITAAACTYQKLLAERFLGTSGPAGTHCDHVEHSCSTTGATRASRECSAAQLLLLGLLQPPPAHPSSTLPCTVVCSVLMWPSCRVQHSTSHRLYCAPGRSRTDGPAPARGLCDRQPRILHDRKVAGQSLEPWLWVARVARGYAFDMCIVLHMSTAHLLTCGQPLSRCARRTNFHAASLPSVWFCRARLFPAVLTDLDVHFRWVGFVGIDMEHGPHR